MGNVERWLIECEAAMRDSLKDSLRRAFDAYAKTPRINWVTDWPGQVRGGRGFGGGGRGESRSTQPPFLSLPSPPPVWGGGAPEGKCRASRSTSPPSPSPQVVICVDCMYWTKEMAEAITRGELSQYSEQCTEELMKVRAGEGGRESARGEGEGLAQYSEQCTEELMKVG